MYDRTSSIGEKLDLYSGPVVRSFTIIDSRDSIDELWYKYGASAICYDAMYSDEMGFYHYGKLKRFYLADISKDFNAEAEAYISSYRELHRMVSENKDLSKLYSFVPEFEIYYDNNKCPYIWTNNVPMRTFEDVFKEILVSDSRTEDALSEITIALKSLCDCIRVLHENNLIHGDINPSNFGFYLRENRILTDGVSLFDLNTLHYDWQQPKSFTPPYYDENTIELKRPNLADVKAIGITLCRAIGLNNEQIEIIKSAGKKYLSNVKMKQIVEEIIFESELFMYKGVLLDDLIKDQIVKIIVGTVSYNPQKITIRSCAKLRDEFQLLETLLLPYCTHDELGRGLGIEIVNKALERKERIREFFQYMLHENPLYLYDNNASSYRVLLIGFGLDAQNFLDVCIETAQSMDKKMEVYVWGTERIKGEKEYYLGERRALSNYFLIDNHTELLTGDSYGSINFCMRKSGTIDDQVQSILNESGYVNYIYIAAGNDRENSEIAEAFHHYLKDKNVSINTQCEQHPPKRKKGINYVWVEDDIRKKEDYADVERMSFNTHLVWSGTLNSDLERKKKNYQMDYYHSSCRSNVLSIEYKLYYLGIDLSNGITNAIKAFKSLKSSEKRKMYASEHRRWVTEKLCDGWVNMSVEDSLRYNDTKDIYNKRHICILRSEESYGLVGEWSNHSSWDNADDGSLATLDELDRMSVKLHQAYLRFAANCKIDDLGTESLKNHIYESLGGYESAQGLFLEWYESMLYMLNDFLQREKNSGNAEWTILECETMHARLNSELDKINDDFLKHSLMSQIQSLYNAFEPVLRTLKYHDYKKNDKELIDSIPFILSYTEDITMIVPMEYKVLVSQWDDVQPSELFSYVAAATLVNPKTLYLPYIVPDNDTEIYASIISQKHQAIKDYVKRKGLRTSIQFIQLEDKTTIEQLLNSNQKELQKGWLLIEDNGIEVIADNEINGTALSISKYTFDMLNIAFRQTESADWLNCIKRNVNITVRDVAGFLGRTVEMKKQPSFRRIDNRILFGIYNSNRVAWRNLCSILKQSNNKKQHIVRFNKPSLSCNSDSKRHIYFLPNSCYKSVSIILKLLKNAKIVEERSYVIRYSADSCKLIVFEKEECGAKLQKIFTRQDLLTTPHKYFIDQKNGSLVLTCDGLTVEDIPINLHGDAHMRKILSVLGKLQEQGFVQVNIKKKSFDITYGSWQIKDLFMSEGNLLEMYTYYKTRELNTFDDVVTGVVFYRGEDKNKENEIDCFATKGFQTVIVECKARAMKKDDNAREELSRIKKALRSKVKKYGINGTGLLILDSETGVPDAEGFEDIAVCSKIIEIANIGEIVSGQIKRAQGDYKNERI